jgi:cell division protease FtsH
VFGPGFVIFFVLLLAFNFALVSTLQTQPQRARIPYSPTFLNQVKAGNVSSISSKGTTVRGDFRTEVSYSPNSSATPTKLFVTEIPEFANDNALSALLQSKGVVINASPPSSGTSVLWTIVLSVGSVLLLVWLLLWLFRRAGGGIGGGVSAFGRSRAQRVEPSEQTVNFEDVAGSTRPRRS